MITRIPVLRTALGAICLLFAASPAFAHVVVTPKEVGVAQRQVFTVAVPTEKDIPTVGLTVYIPSEISGNVTPNAKPGWTINVVKAGDTVTEIDWTGGAIPPGQRDEFLFQVQAPASEGTLQWKAVQKYEDGSTVEWTHAPASDSEDESAQPPFSTTKVINDLTPTTTPDSDQNPSMTFSIVALALSGVSLGIAVKKRKSER